MLALETKQSGGKLLPHSDHGGGECFQGKHRAAGKEGWGCGYMDWIGMAQDRDRWRTLVSAVMNLRVP